MSKITNTGELREYLCKAIDDLANGNMDIETARNITKLAGQVNESLYAEVKVSKTKVELGEKSTRFGDLNLLSSNQ